MHYMILISNKNCIFCFPLEHSALKILEKRKSLSLSKSLESPKCGEQQSCILIC